MVGAFLVALLPLISVIWTAMVNGIPGLQKLDVVVNGERYPMKGLYDGEERTLDVAASMLPGNANTITFRATGKPGGSAMVMISDSE